MSDRTNGRPRVRDAMTGDGPAIWPFRHESVATDETYAWDQDTDEQAARLLWMAPAPASSSSGQARRRRPARRPSPGRARPERSSPPPPYAPASVRPAYGGPPVAWPTPASWSTPPAPGHGIGRLLAEHVLDEARRDGCTAMVFNAVVETDPALSLWRSLGFTILGTVPEAYDHPRRGPVDLHVLHRRL